MAWVLASTLGAAGVGLISGKMSADAKQRQQQTQGEIQAAQTRYSPWTNIQPQGMQAQNIDQGGSMLGGAVNGGLAGLMTAKQMAKKPGEEDPMDIMKKKALYENVGGDPTSQANVG